MILKQVRGWARVNTHQKRIMRSLGFRGKINQMVQVKENPAILGMVAKVQHLIEVQQ